MNSSGAEVKNESSNCLLREIKKGMWSQLFEAKKVKSVLVCLCCWCSDTVASETFPSWKNASVLVGVLVMRG